MIEFLGGSVTLGYVIAGVFFLRFWRRTRDRLFLAFAVAFGLFAVNQALVHLLYVVSEPWHAVYLLRVVGFLVILAAILDKNLLAK